MILSMKEHLKAFLAAHPEIPDGDRMQLPDISLDPDSIRIMMISETVPADPKDYFYSRNPEADFMRTTVPILNSAGICVKTMEDIINKGIYITTATKTPKDGYTIPSDVIRAQSPVLEEELRLFEHLKIIMLMGDVAKKALNLIARTQGQKSVIPSGSTYKLRNNEYYYGKIRVLPSYIITGGNILIEKSKVQMIQEDLLLAQKILSADGISSSDRERVSQLDE